MRDISILCKAILNLRYISQLLFEQALEEVGLLHLDSQTFEPLASFRNAQELTVSKYGADAPIPPRPQHEPVYSFLKDIQPVTAEDGIAHCRILKAVEQMQRNMEECQAELDCRKQDYIRDLATVRQGLAAGGKSTSIADWQGERVPEAY